MASSNEKGSCVVILEEKEKFDRNQSVDLQPVQVRNELWQHLDSVVTCCSVPDQFLMVSLLCRNRNNCPRCCCIFWFEEFQINVYLKTPLHWIPASLSGSSLCAGKKVIMDKKKTPTDSAPEIPPDSASVAASSICLCLSSLREQQI